MNRSDTYSLGICNGCQLMVKQKIFNDQLKIIENDSKRFESLLKVKVCNQDNIFFKDMLNMEFGVWVAHGEGKFINTNTLTKKQKNTNILFSKIIEIF